MYIDYEKWGGALALLLPYRVRSKVRKVFFNLKIAQNCNYAQKNAPDVLKKLRKEVKERPLRVGFLLYEENRWKCQTIYDLMMQDKNFEPFICVTTDSVNRKKVMSHYPLKNLKKTVEFFKTRNMNVHLAYDLENEKHIPLEEFHPDIIIYQMPWSVERTQGPVVCSKFALTYYVPYFVATSLQHIEYYLRFHRYVRVYYVLNNLVKKYFTKKMENKGKNLRVVGHPQLDYFYLNKDIPVEKKYVIYAPHWSINDTNKLNWATFLWSGRFMLDYAKQHSELNWIFKPHPSLKLILEKHMSKEEVEEYYEDWAKIGMRYETGDYMDLFNQSCAMITDCGSFLTEYLQTQQPVIHLVSEDSSEFNDSVKRILQSYYKAQNVEELKKLLDMILINKEDPDKPKRLAVIEELGFKNNFAAKNIVDDIKRELNIK